MVPRLLAAAVAFAALSAPAGAAQHIKTFGGSGTGNGHFNRPYGVAVGPLDDIWVTDHDHNRVQGFHNNGVFRIVFGSHGTGDGQFVHPQGIAVDRHENVYVSDATDHIQAFTRNGKFLRRFGSSGSRGGQLQHVFGLAVTPDDHLLVPEWSNFRISVWTLGGQFVKYFAHVGYHPTAIAVAPDGHVYVTSGEGNHVHKYASDGAQVRSWGGKGTGHGQFHTIFGIGVDSFGGVWVTEYSNHRVQHFDEDGHYLSSFGHLGYAPNAGFYNPWGIGISRRSDFMVIADHGNNRAQIWRP